MDVIKQIDYMIACLEQAKEEATYLKHYKKREKEMLEEDNEVIWKWYAHNKAPNKSFIKDNLRNVARAGFKTVRGIDE